MAPVSGQHRIRRYDGSLVIGVATASSPNCFLSCAQTKFVVLAALFAGASAFCPASKPAFATKLDNSKADWEKAKELGWSMGGEDYTRDVKPQKHEDERKTIHEAPSFEEYMRQRQQQGN